MWQLPAASRMCGVQYIIMSLARPALSCDRGFMADCNIVRWGDCRVSGLAAVMGGEVGPVGVGGWANSVNIFLVAFRYKGRFTDPACVIMCTVQCKFLLGFPRSSSVSLVSLGLRKAGILRARCEYAHQHCCQTSRYARAACGLILV